MSMRRICLLQHARGVFFGLVFFIAACGSPGEGAPLISVGTVHPTPENIPDDTQVADVLQMDNGATQDEHAHFLMVAKRNTAHHEPWTSS